MIYLDNNATTPIAPEISDIMCRCLKTNFGNPSSSHDFGKKAAETVFDARKSIAALLGASHDEITFTSGGTEANNMAILGTALKHSAGHIITSSIEHPSVMNPIKYLEGLGYKVTYLPVDKYGMVKSDDVLKNIKKNTILITIMHSNNETGTLQPIASIGKTAKEEGIHFHCDAAQSVGKVPVNVKTLNVDILTVVSHKFYGPKGIGALYIKNGTILKPITFGASHEKDLRPGTENVCSIAGLGKACELAKNDMKKRVADARHLSKLFHNGLRNSIPGIKLNGHPTKRLPNTLNLSFPGITGSALLERVKNNLAASTGSACHEGKHTASHVLKAMGVSNEDAFSAVRLSLGIFNNEMQVNKAVKAFIKALRGKASL